VALLFFLVSLGVAQGPVPAGERPRRTKQSRLSLDGMWSNATLTPLERPPDFAGRPTLTEKEAAEFADRLSKTLDRDNRDGGADADVSRAYNELFFDRGAKLTQVNGKIPSSLIIDPADGRIPPLTAEALRRAQKAHLYAIQHPADRPEDRSLQERCILSASTGPPMLPGLYNNEYQILEGSDYVMILSEMIHDVRVISLARKQHLPSTMHMWLGDSIGHWEGPTLVVDTRNFTDKTGVRGSDQNLHLIERFRRVDSRSLYYQFVVDDPTAFTKSWTGEFAFVATTGPIYEYACHEGNYALANILAGARKAEQATNPPGQRK
jgi:hypothetical protein